MSARRLTVGQLAAVAVALAALAGVLVLVLVFGRGWWEHRGGSYAPAQVRTVGLVLPAHAQFGDELTASGDVLVDGRKVDAASVRVFPDFRPYRIVAISRRTTPDVGHAVLVHYRFTLQCLTDACVAVGRKKAVDNRFTTKPVVVHSSRVEARGRDGGVVKASIAWSSFQIASRLTDQDAAFNRAELPPGFEAAPVTWRIAPGLVGALLLAAAALFLLGSGWLVADVVRGKGRALRVLRIPAHLTPVDRALALARHAAERGETDEGRKALERLALELRRRGDTGLAAQAGRLAWSVGGPSTGAVDELASAVGSSSNGSRNGK